jgi:hypothetical protein
MLLTSGSQEELTMQCESCKGVELERVLSTVSYSMGSSSKGSDGPAVTSKSCGPGQNCHSITLPGHSR